MSVHLVAGFGPGTEAGAEGRAAVRGVCLSAPVVADIGPGKDSDEAEGRSAGRGNNLSVHLAAGFGPGPEAMAEKSAAGQGACLSAPLVAGGGGAHCWTRTFESLTASGLSGSLGLARRNGLWGALLD